MYKLGRLIIASILILFCIFGVIVAIDDKLNPVVYPGIANTTSAYLQDKVWDIEDEWYHADLILYNSCPDVYVWLEKIRQEDKLVHYNDKSDKRWGYFDIFSQKLFVNNHFKLTNGEKATFIVHEYIHSQQSWVKVFRVALSGNRNILEDEAHRAEQLFMVAIGMEREIFND